MKDGRLFRILYYILEKGKATAGELADKFEVSVRTIYRDIDSISVAGIPIYTEQGKGGGIRLDEDFVLNKSFLSESEKEQIIAALSGMNETNTLYQGELLTKLSALFKIKNTNWIEIDFNSWKNDKFYEKLFNEIKSAILTKNMTAFTYFGSTGEKTKRKVKPVRLLFKNGDWYLYAFCLRRNEFRYFNLSRIKEFIVLVEKYEDDFEDLVLKKETIHKDTIRIELKFDKSTAFRVYDEISEEIIADKEGNLHTSIELPADYNLYSYIFSFGDKAELVKPEEMRMQIKDKIEKMLDKYKI